MTDPSIERLYKRMDMDDLDLVDAFTKAGWQLVALNTSRFQWQSEASGKSEALSTIEEIADFAREQLEVADKSEAAHAGEIESISRAIPEMPFDLANAGWQFKFEDDELYAVHDDLFISTSANQTDAETVIAEAYRMQEDYERQLDEAKQTPRDEAALPAPAIPAGQMLDVDLIRTDGGTQMRVNQLDLLTVTDYAEAMKQGKIFPPVDVFFDGSDYWLADGFQRHAGTKQAELEEINADVHHGTLRDAILFAVGANATHGLPRTNADKRRAVAEAAGVSGPYVKTIRDELTLNGLESPAVRIARDGRVIDTSLIGDRKAAAQLAEQQPVLPGAEVVVAEQESASTFTDSQRRSAEFEMRDPTGELELEANADEEEEARRNFDPVNEANADEAHAEEARRELWRGALKENGANREEVHALHISDEAIDGAKADGLIEERPNGRFFYRWQAGDVVAALRRHGALSRLDLEDLGCQSHLINVVKSDGLIKLDSAGKFIVAKPEVTATDGDASAPPAPDAHFGTTMINAGWVMKRDGHRFYAENASLSLMTILFDTTQDAILDAAAKQDAHEAQQKKKETPPEPAAAPKPPTLRELLKGRNLYLSLSWLTAVEGKVNLSLNFERDPQQAKRLLLGAYEVEDLPEAIRTAIERHLADAPAVPAAAAASPSQSNASKKATATKKAAPVKTAPTNKATATRAAAKGATKKAAAKTATKSTTKKTGARA